MKEIKRFHIARSNSRGFTLIELLIVIGIIAILAAAVFVALNPLKRFQDSRDARRRSDVANILSAIKVNQVDNGGAYLSGAGSDIGGITAGQNHIIGTTPGGIGCDTGCTAVTTQADCINLYPLVDPGGYLGEVPKDPSSGTDAKTGYYISRSAANLITVGSCSPESVAEIKLSR